MANSQPQTFVVPAELAGQTLSAALRFWMPRTSWSRIQKLIRSRRVTVSKSLCVDAARRLKARELVRIEIRPAPPVPRETSVRIRYVDPQVVVVEKPAGTTSVRHPEERHWPAKRRNLQPTLDELLPRLLVERGRRRGQKLPPIRPVHRLDRETSGLIVFARTPAAEHAMLGQFRKHTVRRRYVAIVCGHVEARTIRSHLVRDRGDGYRGSTNLAEVGKLAITHVTPIERLPEHTLVECRLETGRTHQIRIHLSEAGHPVVGDKLYVQPLFAPPIAEIVKAPRLMLHAVELGFAHPASGDWIAFEMPLPPDFQQFLDRLRGGQASTTIGRPTVTNPPDPLSTDPHAPSDDEPEEGGVSS